MTGAAVGRLKVGASVTFENTFAISHLPAATAQQWSLKHNKFFSCAFALSSPICASVSAAQDDEHISFTFCIDLVLVYIQVTDVIEHVQETNFTISLLSRTAMKTIRLLLTTVNMHLTGHSGSGDMPEAQPI